ncbi:hypothetical protein COI53_28515 [Bacillus thuringiensis]|uniref:hypothetical protein n=1 Tax=Bacillus thuringiensis TaxID=1428 RepID=UPI000BF5389E|nr:hypothetical protein [Bacillus thuringiensis]PFI25789.1 hypothetical protein COI53_28515 [Bacillus thuringiensis]PFS51826.1 hypothetical protein COK87_23570 [Bacillus thuringiensis]
MKKFFTQNCLGLYDNGLLIGNNPLETFINYKLLNSSNLKFDCDSSSIVKENLEFLFGEGETTYTDTLISPQSFFTTYLRYYHEDILIKKSKKLIVPNIPIVKNEMIAEGIANNSNQISNSAIWSFYIKKQDIELHESMLEFLDSVYYLSNFSPVCRGFNLGRAAKTADNFFIALDKIFLYFQLKNNGASNLELKEVLSTFLGESRLFGKVYLTEEEVIASVMNWLNFFGSYKEFIEKYCFQSFLEDPYNSSSKPKELWNGLFDGTKLQPSKEEFISCIEFMTNAIKERGVNMYEIFELKDK